MKTTLTTLIALLISGFCLAQGAAKPPKAAQNDLQQRFPNAANARWEQEGNHFEAEWRENGREVAVLYDAAGKYLMTEREIGTNDLPITITAAMNAAMPGAQILEVERQEKGNATTGYQVEVKHQGKVKEVTFDVSGNALGEELEEGNDADGDGVSDQEGDD